MHDSLDTNHSKTTAVQITLDRAEDTSFSGSVFIIGCALASFGFGVYYVFPLSLLAMNFALLLSILTIYDIIIIIIIYSYYWIFNFDLRDMFFFLLIGMIFGLVVLSLNVGHIFSFHLHFYFSSSFSFILS